MEIFLYILFGFLDSMAVMSLMFCIFMLPIREYLREVISTAILVAIFSYFMRMQFNLVSIDPLSHLIIFMLFWRFILKARNEPSIVISLSGYIAYIIIQSAIVFPLLELVGIVSNQDAVNSNGFGTYSIQLCAEILAFILCFILIKFNLGISRYVRPPHDFIVKRDFNTSSNKVIYIPLIIFLVFCLSFYLMIHFSVYSIIPIAIATFIFLILISNNRAIKR